MEIRISTPKEAYQWLTSEKWIVFSYDGTDFCHFLEETVFKPATKKNAEFEVAVIPVEVDGQRKITFWYRFLDTPANRVAFAEAMALYYKKTLPSDWEKRLETLRKKLKELLSYDDRKLYLKGSELGVSLAP